MARDYCLRRCKCAVCGRIIPAEGRRVITLVKPSGPQRRVVCGDCFRARAGEKAGTQKGVQ